MGFGAMTEGSWLEAMEEQDVRGPADPKTEIAPKTVSTQAIHQLCLCLAYLLSCGPALDLSTRGNVSTPTDAAVTFLLSFLALTRASLTPAMRCHVSAGAFLDPCLARPCHLWCSSPNRASPLGLKPVAWTHFKSVPPSAVPVPLVLSLLIRVPFSPWKSDRFIVTSCPCSVPLCLCRWMYTFF